MPSLSQSAWNTQFNFGHQKVYMDNDNIGWPWGRYNPRKRATQYYYYSYRTLCVILLGKNNIIALLNCHNARGIHDFILATKSPIWIIINVTFFYSAALESGKNIAIESARSRGKWKLKNNYSHPDHGLKISFSEKFLKPVTVSNMFELIRSSRSVVCDNILSIISIEYLTFYWQCIHRCKPYMYYTVDAFTYQPHAQGGKQQLML